MLHYNHYVRAQSLDEAYELAQKRRNSVLGGMIWLNLSRGSRNTVIDLCDLGLSGIEERDADFRIGAYTSLYEMETHKELNDCFHGVFRAALGWIEGVQLRNMATLGGSVVQRAGYSDVCTLLLAMDAALEFHHGGTISMADYLKRDRRERDILVNVLIPKASALSFYQSLRNSKTDLPVLNCAVTKRGEEVRIVLGARPGLACLHTASSAELSKSDALAEKIADSTVFESNIRASAEYRRMLAVTLVTRTLEELEKEGRE